MTELTADQKNKVRETLVDIMAPYREKDSKEALELIDQAGFDHLHMAFSEMDLEICILSQRDNNEITKCSHSLISTKRVHHN